MIVAIERKIIKMIEGTMNKVSRSGGHSNYYNTKDDDYNNLKITCILV